jgi:hypothetical protein
MRFTHCPLCNEKLKEHNWSWHNITYFDCSTQDSLYRGRHFHYRSDDCDTNIIVPPFQVRINHKEKTTCVKDNFFKVILMLNQEIEFTNEKDLINKINLYLLFS